MLYSEALDELRTELAKDREINCERIVVNSLVCHLKTRIL
jgi:hypothetical protein